MRTTASHTSTSSGKDGSSELELMRRVKAGDVAALDEVVAHWWAPLVAYADRFLDGDAAEDAAQDAFVRFWEGRHDWEPTERLSSFLYRITRNLALNECRRRRTRLLWIEKNSEERQPAGATPLQELELSELERAVETAIAALPPRRREIFILVRFHDLSHSEIAEIMEISPQTVANQMTSAIGQLRRSLKPYLDRPAFAAHPLVSVVA